VDREVVVLVSANRSYYRSADETDFRQAPEEYFVIDIILHAEGTRIDS
jgi:hypothetical protein